jgi:GDPmannose 4,6-dehydratase
LTRALICGVSGQDGAYLARLLLEKGYEVIGSSRDAEMSRFESLSLLGVRDKISVRSMALNDFRSVLQVLTDVEPDEIYNLAGQSSVGLSFAQPVETMESIALGTLNLLEAVRMRRKETKLYNAASGDCFGQTTIDSPANEDSALRPRSPYGVAKSAAFWEVANYREAYGLFACSGLLFNHESFLRPARFVTRKVINAAVRIAAGADERLKIGDTRVQRDWGWAPEYVDAMWRMLQQDTPRDYVIATGESNTLAQFIDATFNAVGLDAGDHVDTDPALLRAADIMTSYADPGRAAKDLGWVAQTHMRSMIEKLVADERKRIDLL